MIKTKLVSLLALSMLAPALALAQAPPADAAKAGQRPQMYEDIEIMRQLLNQKLRKADQTVQPAPYFYYQDQLNAHRYSNLAGAGINAAPQTALSALGGQFGSYGPSVPRSETEGVYLKGQGVVFTITLPPPAHDPRPAADKAAPKASASDWDRARSELRGEKLPPPNTTETKSAPVADVILKLLADNGHRFTQLGAEEGLIVVVTFRPAGHLGKSSATNQQTELIESFNNPNAATRAAAVQALGQIGDTPRAAANEHEILGDLHLKQGKTKEAIEAYQKALEKEPKREAVLNKLIQANVAANNYTKAQELLKNAKDMAKQPPAATAETANPPQATASALPAKLLISAPKKLLDLAGTGKISFDEFKKAAIVEYLAFPAATAEKK